MWNEETQREAYLLNDSIIVYRSQVEGQKPALSKAEGSNVTHLSSLVACDSSNVIMETIKQAEDGNGLIVRLYESQRKRGQVRIQVGGDVESAWETNLLEEDQAPLLVESGQVILNVRPYQIMTLRLKLKM
jgi:alpha-mannosidase